MATTTPRQQIVHGEAMVSTSTTVIIVVAGVVGGLFIVVCVILCCKYCVKSKKYSRRQPGFDRERASERRLRYRQRYETINSDVFSEPSSASLDGVPLSPRRHFALSQEKVSEDDEADETTKLKTDFDKGQLADGHEEVDEEKPADGERCQNGGRYTEGDFHHFKRYKVERSPGVPRQCSLGTYPASHTRSSAFQAASLRSSLRDRLLPTPSHTPPATSPRRHDVRSSPSPPSPFRPIHDSTSSQVFRGGASPSASGSVPTHPSPIPSTSFRTFSSSSSSHRSFNGSPSPPYKATKTQVAVEVHHYHGHKGGNSHAKLEAGENRRELRPVPPQSLRTNGSRGRRVHSHSMETVSPTQRKMYREARKVKSYEDVADYDVLKITEFSKGPFYSTDYDVISELGSPRPSKVRYNDTGSLEKLNDDHIEYDLDLVMVQNESDDTETLNGTQKYRELWNLRATLEEEEECSDTIRMEDMTSPEVSPDREAAAVYTTSFESNTDQMSDPGGREHRDSGIQWEGPKPSSSRHGSGQGGHLLHPNYENRRQNYRNILTKRLQRSAAPASAENSFDSIETDGDVSDTSRYEMTTTSFESTTDNTDSAPESQTSRLRQMKADSGYKSLETQQSQKDNGGEGDKDKSPVQTTTATTTTATTTTSGATTSGERPETSEGGSTSEQREQAQPKGNGHKDCGGGGGGGDGGCDTGAGAGASAAAGAGVGYGMEAGATGDRRGGRRGSQSQTSHLERRAARTASKKRREYSRERQAVRVYESINEPETDSRSDQPSGDSFDDTAAPSKVSVFARFFRSQSRESRERYLVRDFSIDEKTNKIFNEFLRRDPGPDTAGGSVLVRRSPRLHPRPRLQRKHTEPASYGSGERRRDRLAPDMRSHSLGSDSSASSARRLSPQDSIEEEGYEEGGGVVPMETAEPISELGLHEESSQPKAIHDIPIIKLPEEESGEV